MGIIDVHVHHRWGGTESRPSDHLDRTKRLAHLSGISSILLLGPVLSIPPDPSPEQIRQSNTNTLRIMEDDPEFYWGACYLNPAHDPAFIREEAKRCVEAGMVAIKLWIAVKASDRRCDPVMDIAAEVGVPVFIHAWYKTTGNLPGESSGADIADLARRHPDVTTVLLHLPGVKYRGVADIKDLPNVWIDTSGGQPESDIVEYAVRHLGAERILYGSDAYGRHYGTQLGRVKGASISEEEKELILWRNALRLLKPKAKRDRHEVV